MNVIKQGFEVSYNVIPEYIKSRDGGTFNGMNYKPAVTLTAINVIEDVNEVTDVLDVKKTELSFEVICENLQEVKALSEYFRNEIKAHRPILLTGSLPYGDKVKCFENASSFLKKGKN